ncbi:MAG: glucosaminidase domain-containing protein [Sneathiella sp.]
MLLLAMAYVVPEFIGGKQVIKSVSNGISEKLFTKDTTQQNQFDLASLNAALNEVNFRLDDVRDGAPVPRFYVDQIPVDMIDVIEVEERKRTFIKLVLPQVLNINESIVARREQLKMLLERKKAGGTLTANDRKWLEELASRYREKTVDPATLLEKVDKVPVSLALAQAVEESGWGTSRFAREGNALFGQRVWATGEGIVPEDRNDSETHEVRAFKSIAESVRSYVHNLNVHPAYEEFRAARARSHAGPDQDADGLRLIETLHVYSEKGQEYVENLRTLIETNRFQDFEDATLTPEQLAHNRP